MTATRPLAYPLFCDSFPGIRFGGVQFDPQHPRDLGAALRTRRSSVKRKSGHTKFSDGFQAREKMAVRAYSVIANAKRVPAKIQKLGGRI
jgi:hypothetical protein